MTPCHLCETPTKATATLHGMLLCAEHERRELDRDYVIRTEMLTLIALLHDELLSRQKRRDRPWWRFWR